MNHELYLTILNNENQKFEESHPAFKKKKYG